MVEVLSDLPGNVVGLCAHGRLTVEDYEQVIEPAVHSALEGRETVSVLFELGEDFGGMSAQAMWHDAKLGLRHRKDFGRIAVVANGTRLAKVAKALAPIIPVDLKVFHREEAQQARDWVVNSH